MPLPPSPGLSRLHDTPWEPTHVPVDLAPGNGMPVHRPVGGCTKSGGSCHLLVLLHRWARCSREARPEGSLPADAWGAGADAPPLSVSRSDGVRFFPPPVPAAPSARLTTRLPSRERYGLPVFRFCARMGEVRPVRRQRDGPDGSLRRPPSVLHTLWSQPVSAFGLLTITTLIRRAPRLTLPCHPRSDPPWRSQARQRFTGVALL